ncbi:hypothetical protein [Natronococcus occultus]|uniref:Uncharacterized protein n=1 Tax=Natronococcus occultus SP4 TaxID=694430 RepID=L0JU51_9EURY|nr:hypothetical protein [Natronococcus occultus]AGB36547.1 hypothetical protein Natoc_0687 [Natronococcus occultus SP4]
MGEDEVPHRRVEPDDPVPGVIWCLVDATGQNRVVGTFLTRKAAKEEGVTKAKARDLTTEDFPVVAVHYKDLHDLYRALSGGIREDVLVPTSDGFQEFRAYMESDETGAAESADDSNS